MQHDNIAAEVGFMVCHFSQNEMGVFWMRDLNDGDLLVTYGSAECDTHAERDLHSDVGWETGQIGHDNPLRGTHYEVVKYLITRFDLWAIASSHFPNDFSLARRSGSCSLSQGS